MDDSDEVISTNVCTVALAKWLSPLPMQVGQPARFVWSENMTYVGDATDAEFDGVPALSTRSAKLFIADHVRVFVYANSEAEAQSARAICAYLLKKTADECDLTIGEGRTQAGQYDSNGHWWALAIAPLVNSNSCTATDVH